MKSYSAEQAGLSKRDYVPLAIAVFVDICLLLVSMGRPMNRLQGLVPKMVAAERGPVYQILSRFTDIHSDAEMRQKFEIFRHVVFDYGGDYYVAVPLDAPWNRNPREQQELLAEAHLLSNLFSSFEKEKIFKRVYSPFLKTASIQKKLGRQGSKFTHCKAFRIYRFADGAWSEIILGAVMGAAKRVEAEKRRRRDQMDATDTTQEAPAGTIAGAFRDVSQQVRPPAPMMQPPAAGFDVPRQMPQAWPPQRPIATPHHWAPAQSAASRGPAVAPWPAAIPAATTAPVPANDTTAAYGPYARFQPPAPQPSADQQRDATVAQWTAELALREADVSVRHGEPQAALHMSENVVAMPVRQPLPQAAPAETRGPGVDVEMTRETIRYTVPGEFPAAATMTVPTSPAVLPAALARLAAAGGVMQPLQLAVSAAANDANMDVETGEGHDAAAMAQRLIAREPAE